MTATTITVTDALGVTIQRGDTVTVIAWGAPVRLTDTGRRARVVNFTPRGNVILDDPQLHSDPIARGRAVSPGYLAVARRDGKPGHEGNRPRRCTCGARDLPSCLDGLTPAEWTAAHPDRPVR